MEPTIAYEERHLLRRPLDRRMIGGVAAGVADYVDVDVVVVRIVLVVLAVMGGIGLPLYLAAWLLVPERGSDESVVDHLFGRVRYQGRDMASATTWATVPAATGSAATGPAATGPAATAPASTWPAPAWPAPTPPAPTAPAETAPASTGPAPTAERSDDVVES